jgi:hypothetical protein
MEVTLGLRAMAAGELGRGHLEVLGETPTVFQGEVHKTVLPPGETTLPRPLTLKPHTLGPPFVFCHDAESA